MPRNERPPDRKRDPQRRFEIDPIWLRRGALALALVAFVVVLAKATIMMFSSGGNKRLERQERAAEHPDSAQPAKPAAPR